MFGATNLPALALRNTNLRPPNAPANTQPLPQSFVVPLLTNLIVLPDAIQIGYAMFVANGSAAQWSALPWDDLTQPHWGLNLTNRLRCIVMDGGVGGRVVDYVQLNHLEAVRNLTDETINKANKLDVWTLTPLAGQFWA